MHKCVKCGKLTNKKDNRGNLIQLCSKCVFDDWAKRNPKYCEWCHKLISPTEFVRYAEYSKIRFHKGKCLTEWKRSVAVKKEVELPLCKCGCGLKVKEIGRMFHNSAHYIQWSKTNHIGYLGGEFNTFNKKPWKK